MTSLTSTGQSARGASLSRQQTARRVCVGASAAALGLYLASPFVTLWTIGSSLRSHDMAALGHLINWSELDSSIKHQTLSSLHLNQVSDDLPDFGSSFATTAVSNAVDFRVTQANLGTLVDQALPSTLPANQATPSFAKLAEKASVRFTRIDQFEADIPLPGHEQDTPLKIEMRIQNWRWKVTRVEFPTRRAPVMQASASPSNA
ncbi:DUF2939 domain-containing protein [Acetobacter farinalis]|uniref:DUF2939 domain-containing protein n=1 Tax=Acetobacter farinalis TaxID=1260984 RepID=A0ABT3Q9K1_9PROT|nr:DUF2939 domain-containing protein [Acetobacter farinalis]MCX2561956.1 DUF2939 domain-containing protein [Acetobacter farinalis]NHO30559.1 DUF2939 domain-containing protein [Acetobacter farinalis]